MPFPFFALSSAVALMCCGAAPEADAASLKPLPELRIDLASHSAVIASPDRPEYRDIAQRLAKKLAEAIKHQPRVAVGSMKPGEFAGGPVIVLGNLMDSELARSLYLQAYDFTDYAWPGAGGFVLRTIRDPFGTGAHVVMVGGSDAGGVAEAADRLAQIARQRGPRLGYANEVKLGRWALDVKQFTQDLLTGDDAFWQRSSGTGSWDYQSKIAKAAIGYLRTGKESYLPVFRRELRGFFDHDVRNPNPEAPQMVHGFMNTLIIPWDLVRDHPRFTSEERLQFDEDFLYVFRSSEGPRRIASAAKRRVVRDNHGTRTGLDALFGGRYFLRRYGLKEVAELAGDRRSLLCCSDRVIEAGRRFVGASVGGVALQHGGLRDGVRQAPVLRLADVPGSR